MMMDSENMDPLPGASAMTSQYGMQQKQMRQPLGALTNNLKSLTTRNGSKNISKREVAKKAFIEPMPEIVDDNMDDEFDRNLDCVIDKCENFNVSEALKESNVLYSKHRIIPNRHFHGPNDSIDLYYKDVMPYVHKLEKRFCPTFNNYETQTDVTYEMRLILADWLAEVAQDFKFDSETLALAINYVEIFLGHLNINKHKFQLLGITALFLAAKVEEVYTPETSEYINITANTYTLEELIKMERVILKAIKFNVYTPTPLYFLRAYLSQMNVPSVFEHLSHYFCEMAIVLGGTFLRFLPSQIAASSLVLACFTFGTERNYTTPLRLTPYSFSDIVSCFNELHEVMQMITPNGATIKAKYSTYQYNKVATIVVPAERSLLQII